MIYYVIIVLSDVMICICKKRDVNAGNAFEMQIVSYAVGLWKW